MLIDDNGRIARNVTGNFFLSFLINEAAKPSNVDVMTTGHVRLNDIKKCFNGSRNICLIDTCFFCDLIDYVCFGHGGFVYRLYRALLKIRDGKFKRSLLKRKMNLLIITYMEDNSQTKLS